jgi:hypothetical protein
MSSALTPAFPLCADHMQGQWVVGVIDGLSRDPARGWVSLTETKTRLKPTRPPEEQVASARLQVGMVGCGTKPSGRVVDAAGVTGDVPCGYVTYQ